MGSMPTDRRFDGTLRYLPHLLFVAWCALGVVIGPPMTGGNLLAFALLVAVPGAAWLILRERRPDLFPELFPTLSRPVSGGARWVRSLSIVVVISVVLPWLFSHLPGPWNPLQGALVLAGLIDVAYLVAMIAIRRWWHSGPSGARRRPL
jgi:sterol desaturase/sphingolipid hydroxylase (fatty acid hydroxylase superfamily)